MTGIYKTAARRVALVAAGAVAGGVLLIGAPTVTASAAPGDCFGIPQCNIFPGIFTPTLKGGGAYAKGGGGGGYANPDIGGGGAYANGGGGGAASRGQAGGAYNHTP